MEGKIKQKNCQITIYFTPSTLSFDGFFHPNFSAISRICLIATTNVISKYLLVWVLKWLKAYQLYHFV